MQYTPDVIRAACGKYLGPEVVTVTQRVWGSRVVVGKCGDEGSYEGVAADADAASVYHEGKEEEKGEGQESDHADVGGVENGGEGEQGGGEAPQPFAYEDGNPLIEDVEVPDQMPEWLSGGEGGVGERPSYQFEDGNDYEF